MNSVAVALRSTLASSPWIPESARPRPPPTKVSMPAQLVPVNLYDRLHSWVMDNKILTGTVIVSVTAITFQIIRRRKTYGRKRRAKRASNGARLEVVVIAGSPGEAITRSLALDLERRGFIVYVICNTIEEEVQIQNESRPDIRPLMIDIVDVSPFNHQITYYTLTSNLAFKYTCFY